MTIDDKVKLLRNESFVLKEENGSPITVKPEGSLGILAVGYKGVIAWKKVIEKSKIKPEDE